MKLVVVLILTLLFTTPSVAEGLVWKTEPLFEKIEPLPTCDMEKEENCHDIVPYIARSQFGVNMYFTYYEGTRFQLGFGTRPNEHGGFATAQNHPGEYDWGGIEVDGVFKPIVVIKRFFDLGFDWGQLPIDKTKTALMIFRLAEDGTSCIVSSELTNDNATARKWAERALKEPGCSTGQRVQVNG